MVLILGLVLANGFTPGASAAPPEDRGKLDPALVKELKDGARGSVSLSINQATGFASFIVSGRNGDLIPQERAQPQGKAKGFLKKFGAVMGVGNADSELVQVSVTTDELGATHVTYAQQYRGLRVYGGVLKAHVDASGNLTAVNGTIVPNIAMDTSPRLTARQATARAIATVVADPPGGDDGAPARLSAGDLRAESAELLVYRIGLVKGEAGTNELAYEVVVTNGGNVRDAVFVHANTGKVINRYTLVDNALYRRLFEENTSNQVWQEGDPFPGALNSDQQNIVNFSGDSYYFFFNAFGVDSYDQAGAEMQSVNNDPRISCPNANWNGLTTNYCNGVTADDVVAHEWGHAYTDYTSDLIYQWQSGALNESYSDIWGETVDMLNGAGTDSPDDVRSVGACSIYTTPVPVLRINSPASIAQDCPAGAASFGPALSSPGITGNVVLGDDGVDVGSDACTPLVNAAAVAGNIALVDRGLCAFTIKVKNAQDAGATAVIVADNVPGPVAGMSGADPTITIPSLRITLDKGNEIKGELGVGVNVTLTVKGGSAPEDSYRWLMGEDATAFGSAIRDMWTPTCKGDPGKVTDAEYHCAASDGGGVHSNSGVPNHGYALLVDGGTYNGQAITAIGLVKASHLYWRAQAVYQTPTTNFNDHADALQASCQDLIGVGLEGLSTSSTPAGPSGEAISADDCASVDAMIVAVELRTDPSEQCNFQPILQQGAPALCGGNQKNPAVIYTEDFEDGLTGWTLTNEGVFSGWPDFDWAAATTLPGGRSGSAAFATDPNEGNCDGGAGDISGHMSLISPAIHLPNSAIQSPRLTFEHYVATEAGWDGGNVKISINGGPFELLGTAAYSFNPYNATLQTAAAGNTNPLAGQPAFTGTDGGSLFGSWGESQVDLTAAGAAPGDSIQVLFDFGMDGCSGNDGWYVDDVTVSACNTKKQARP
ncbi:MAG TPA: M4 family metallopeptidase [Candidatus Limnocylindria bacterium]